MSTGRQEVRNATAGVSKSDQSLEAGVESSFDSLNSEEFVHFESVDDSGAYSSGPYCLDSYSDLTDSNLFVGAEKSAKVFAHYFGQIPVSKEDIEDRLEQGGRNLSSGVESLENTVFMGLDVFEYGDIGDEIDYDRDRIVRRHEGEISDRVVDYLVDESPVSDHVEYYEDMEAVVIRPGA